MRSADYGMRNEKSTARSAASVYKTFGRSYIKRLVVPTIEFTAGAASGLTACGLL